MHLALILLLVSLQPPCFGQQVAPPPPPGAELDLGAKTLEDLLEINTSVATRKGSGVRSAPGILSIITDEDIRAMGARDLIDVLRLVPGFHFAADTQGVVGLGVRGMWAQEGKYLLLIDGIEANEIQYGGFQFGNELPVRHIKRIELIRGPGSVIYGGFAELAVINIITKKGADLKGFVGEAVYGQMTSTTGRQNVGLQSGGQIGDWDVSVAAYLGEAKRGTGAYSGFRDEPAPAISGSFDFKDADTIKPAYFNLGVSRSNFKFRYILHEHRLTTRAMYSYTGLDADIPNDFRTHGALSSFDMKLGPKITVTPQAQFLHQTPWRQVSEEAQSEATWYDIKSERLKVGISASYEPTKSLNFLLGHETTRDQHKIKTYRDSTGADLKFSNGAGKASYQSKALLGQAIWKTPLADLSAGARYEDPNFTKSSFLPRFGLTRAERNWHYKLLYSQAFRSPVQANIDARPSVRPEQTETVEAEFGHSLSRESYLTANIFDTKIRDPIVYYYDPVLGDQYDNFATVGTRGLELNYSFKASWGMLQAGYSFYVATQNRIEQYAVDTERDAFLGLPQHQFTFNSRIRLGVPNLHLNPTIIALGDRYGYEYSRRASGMAIQKTSPRVLTHLYLERENLLMPGLIAGVGAFNIFNQSVRYIQAYDGGAGSTPGPSREFVARLEYRHTY